MARYKLTLAYDGTNYAGYQRQPTRVSVQLVLETALKQLGWSGKSVLVAGRTDRGVHASGQVVSFDLDWQHGEQILLRALNAHLPQDIAAREVRSVDQNFHPRYDATHRTYRYQLYFQPGRDPLQDRYAWRLWPAPDVTRMHQAAQDLLGEHDFIAFGKAMKPGATTIRKVTSANWSLVPEGARFEICANAFLYHMVRRIVYVLVQIGYGKLQPTTIRQGLESGTTGLVALAPAHGLSLVHVNYLEMD